MTGDDIGDLLREVYDTFGMPGEGPPAGLDVTALMGAGVPEADLDVLRAALRDQVGRRQVSDCRAALDDLATRLQGEELLRELSVVSSQERHGIDVLSSGVFWFALAGSLDSRNGSLPVTPLDETVDLPLPLKVQMTVVGSLVLRLYVALVYMREGVVADRISAGARAGGPCSGKVRKLLGSDYIRQIRNALSHGSFHPCIAGIVFRDEHRMIVATPGFLSWLCTWLMLIQLQALAAGARRPDGAA